MNHLIGKTVKTRGGFDVEIIAVRPELDQPIVGIYYDESDDRHILDSWYMDGLYQISCKTITDLVLE